MLDLIRKSFEAALGGLNVAQEKLKEVADELVVKGHLTKKEAEALLKDLKGTAREGERKVAAFAEEQVKRVMKEMGVATASEIKALKGRIDKLEKSLEKAKGKKEKAPAKPAGEKKAAKEKKEKKEKKK